MKRKILKWLILSVMICAFLVDALAQPTAVINYIDASGYPNLKAFYTYRDAGGNQVRPPNYSWVPQDIIINENGVIKPHNTGSPACPPPNQKSFSVILVFDISLSMTYGMDGTPTPPAGQEKFRVGFRAMDHFIQALDPTLTECAIIEFGQMARVRQTWTTDKDSLIKVVTEEPIFGLNTNYNAAFLRNRLVINNNVVWDSTQSPLYVAKSAKYKPVIIFLTDGKHNPGGGDPGSFDVAAAFTLAKKRNVYVFVVKIGNEALDAGSLGNLNTMAGVEGNIGDNIAMDVTDPDALIGFYDKVLQICGQVGYPGACNVEWVTECTPNGVRSLDLTFPNHGNLTASTTFTVPGNIKPYLDISPNPIDFKNITPPTYSDVPVRITAKNNLVDFYGAGYTSTDPRYSIVNWGGVSPPFPLKKDSSRIITVRYTPTDSWCSSGFIDFLSSSCSGRIQVSGMLDQFVQNVNMGDELVNSDKDLKIMSLFCNRSCNSVTVTGLDITTGDAGMFSHFGILTLPKVLIPGECIEDTFRFSPKSQGPKSSKIKLVMNTGTEKDTLIANIYGNGIGLPGITSVNPVVFQNTDCKTTSRDTIIQLKNTGPITLNITPGSSGLVGPNASEFTYSPDPLPLSIGANDSIAITIHFQPRSSGAKQCSLHVRSDADSMPDYYIQIDGFADSVNYEPNSYTVDLGIVCLGDTKDTIVNLTNVGTKGLHITPFVTPPTMTLNKLFWDLNGGANEDVSVRFTPTTDGPISLDLIFTESLCNIQKTVHFIGTVHDPKVTPNTNVTITSNVGVPIDYVIRVTNTSTSVGLSITPPVTFQDPQFTFVSSNPVLPYTVLPSGFIDITVRYLPTSATITNTNMVLKGMPCKDVLVPLVGNPSMATVDIFIDSNHTGLVGQVVPIPVILKNANKFAESGTTSIDFDVSFDASLLQQNTPVYGESLNGNNRTLRLRNIPVTSTNSTQTVVTLNLLVTAGTVTSTPLTFTNNPRSNKDNVVFNRVNGLFRLVEASATIYTINNERFPGEPFELEIWQKDAMNLSPFHNSITAELRCNATVLERVGVESGYPDQIDIAKGERIVTLKGIPINNSPGVVKLTYFNFRPMLGNSDTTYVILQNIRSDSGKINFTTVDSKLTLKGVCVDPNTGIKRLFDPTRGAALLEAVNPNPSSGVTEIKFTLSEPGITNIWLSNVLGDKILNIANEDMKPGSKTLYFDANDLPDGVYFVIMQTPTQIFKRQFSIIN